MIPTRALSLATLALAAAVAGCAGSGPGPDGGTGGGGGGSSGQCFFDTDCPDPVLFACNKTTAACEPSCVNNADCSAARRGAYALDFCSTSAGGLGCVCDQGRCQPSLCSSDAQCGPGLACRDGTCVSPPTAAEVSRCEVVPDLQVMRVGASATFRVLAFGAAGAPVVVPAGASWSAVAAGPLAAATGAGASMRFTAQSPTAESGEPAPAVEAAVGTATCRGAAIVLPAAPPAASEVWAVVTDELSGRPVPGVAVLLSREDGSPASDAGVTDGRGLARLAAPAGLATFSVTAFGPDHDYLTVAGYQGSTRYLALVTRRNPVDRYGGFAGSYLGLPATTDVHLGFAGTSLPGAVTSLSLETLLGPSVPTDIRVGSINQAGVPVPAGVTIGLGSPPIKGRFAALGAAGTCLGDAGVPDEARIAAGACGTRTAWSLAGDAQVNQLLALGTLFGGSSTPDLGTLFTQLGPTLKGFKSTVRRDVAFGLEPTPRLDGGQPDFSAQAGFTALDLPFAQLPLGFDFALKLPDLPRFRGTYATAALAVGGAAVPGRGLVPLGLGAGVNSTPQDARLDQQGSYAGAGLLGVRMAPAHHGLEGSPYQVLVAALASVAGDAAAASGASALVARPASLSFNPDGTAPVDLSARPFPVLPDGARFNFASAADPDGLPARGFRFAAGGADGGAPPDLSQVGLMRVVFTDDLSRRWVVLVNPARADAGFQLPAPPAEAAVADRLFASGVSSGPRSSLTVETERLDSAGGADGGTPLGFLDLVEVGAPGADRAGELLTGFSFLAYGRPAVAFTTPATTPATVLPTSKLVLKVTGFRLGTVAGSDGVVGLAFSGGAGCPAVVLSQETTPGNGVLEATLAGTCTGARTATATLLRPDGVTPVFPGVSASVQLTIQ